jgi:hypothetical protein
MHLFQVGNACARSWARLLSSSDQEHIYLKVQQAIEDHLEISPLQSDQERKQASIRMKLWENINANAIRFRDERRDSPDDVDTRERFGPGTSGDIGVFSVVLEENETEFE